MVWAFLSRYRFKLEDQDTRAALESVSIFNLRFTSPFWKRSLTWVQLLILGMIAVSVTIWLRGDSPTACGCFGQTPIPWTGHFLILLGLVASLGHLQAIRGRLART